MFSTEEEQQLQLLFGQNAANLETVLEVCSYIFEQAVYEDIAADRLRAELVSAGVKEAQADAFGRVWTGEGPSLVEACRSKPLGTPMVLDTIKWQMNLALAHTGLSRAKDTAALFELGLKSADESSVRLLFACCVRYWGVCLFSCHRTRSTSRFNSHMMSCTISLPALKPFSSNWMHYHKLVNGLKAVTP